MTTTTRHLLVALATLLLTSGCYLQSDGRSLETRLHQLEQDHQLLHEDMEQERERVSALIEEYETEIDQLREALVDARNTPARTIASLGSQLEELQRRIAELEGRIEVLNHENNQLHEELELVREDFELQLLQLMED